MEKARGIFPIFVNLKNKKILVVGAGSIAVRRINTLLPFDCEIDVVSPEIRDEGSAIWQNENIHITRDCYKIKHIRDADIVLACTDNEEVNNQIYADCKCAGVLVNICTDKKKCDFYFPALITNEEIVIGISSEGNSHTEVRHMRQRIEGFLEEYKIQRGKEE